MKVKVAIIGSGFGLYGLLPAFQQISECEIVGICGKNSPRMIDYCQKTSVPAIFQDWRELIEKTKPDAIAIAVVPKHQYEIIMYALQKGISIFAEKPLTTNLEQAKELVLCAQKAGRPNMVDFIFPEMPQWIQTKKLLNENIIGKITQLTVNWSFLSYEIKNRINSWKSDPQEGGGALSFYFCHVFHNLEFFLGRIKTLHCELGHSPSSLGKGETLVSMVVRWESGCVGNIVLNCGSVGMTKHVWEFQGEKGTLVLQNMSKTVGRDFEIIHYNSNAEVINIPAVEKTEQCLEQDERVVQVQSLGKRFIAWHKDGISSKPDFKDALRVQELIELAQNSVKRQGEIK